MVRGDVVRGGDGRGARDGGRERTRTRAGGDTGASKRTPESGDPPKPTKDPRGMGAVKEKRQGWAPRCGTEKNTFGDTIRRAKLEQFAFARPSAVRPHSPGAHLCPAQEAGAFSAQAPRGDDRTLAPTHATNQAGSGHELATARLHYGGERRTRSRGAAQAKIASKMTYFLKKRSLGARGRGGGAGPSVTKKNKKLRNIVLIIS